MLSLLFFVLLRMLLWISTSEGSLYQYPVHPTSGQQHLGYFSKTSLDDWLYEEEKLALAKLLANVAPGLNTEDVPNGTVIASPSKKDPDYFYQWTRDSAITARILVRIAHSNPGSLLSQQILDFLDSYASLQSRLQHTSNPSGAFADLSGLGEPKFYADGSAYRGSWGRPQRDGPALRALALMDFFRICNQTYPLSWAGGVARNSCMRLYEPKLPADSVIKADLEYSSHHWQDAGFDLWEEMDGLHFYTAMVQKRALEQGAELAEAFADGGAQKWYRGQANELQRFIKAFWSEEKGHLVATLNTPRSGLDCGLILGALHGTDLDVTKDEFPPWSDEILVSLLRFIADQQMRFPVNAPAAASKDPLAGTAMGRYPEDLYNGNGISLGNPWFLCTASVAEILYRSVVKIVEQGWLDISPLGLEFWSTLNPGDIYHVGTITSGSAEFNRTLERLQEVGDCFLAIVKQHADAEGSLSEQIDRVTGFEIGAPDLTWSYGALLEATDWRRRASKALTY